MHAVRNIRLCTKDCLCLYVCPTGATDTETGQIDAEKCRSGCRACVDACPSHAISLVPETYPPPQEKCASAAGRVSALAASKARQAHSAAAIQAAAKSPAEHRFAKAVRLSNQMMAEDLMREAGYMLPQSKNVLDLLRRELDAPQADDFPRDAVRRLIGLLTARQA
jgi:Fe-S-cluster-containing dehydrogenase component